MEYIENEIKKNIAQCCPVCHGKGIVPQGFYTSTGMTWISNSAGSEKCRSCQGKGYIII